MKEAASELDLEVREERRRRKVVLHGRGSGKRGFREKTR